MGKMMLNTFGANDVQKSYVDLSSAETDPENGDTEKKVHAANIEVEGLTLQRELRRIDGMSLIISSIIGSGIFAAPGVLLSNVGGDATLAMIVWIFGSVLAACMGFVYAELGTLMPSAGGEYTYVRVAYGDAISFLWSFSKYWVIDPAERGILAFTCARYFYGGISPNDTENNDGVWQKKLIAVVTILFVTALNCFQIKFAARVFASFVSLKFILVTLLAVFMIIELTRSTETLKQNFAQPFSTAKFGQLGQALIAAMWAYGGSNKIIYVGEELKDPQKDTAPAIIYSILIALLAYVTCNLSYFTSLTSNQIMETSVVATDTARVVVGVAGACVVSIFISISVLGTLFNGILQSGRFGYATARDGQFPRFMARLSRSQKTPYIAILIQGAMCVFYLSIPGSSINTLLGFTKPVEWTFDLILVAALVRLRFKMKKKTEDGEKPSSFKMPLYPLPLGVVIASSLYMIINSLVNTPLKGTLGFVFVSVAFPIHYFFVRPHMRRQLQLKMNEDDKTEFDALGDSIHEFEGAAALAPASAMTESVS